jgi:hypothetical protein
LSKWWNNLSEKEQKAYLKDHPDSKYKITKKKGKNKKKKDNKEKSKGDKNKRDKKDKKGKSKTQVEETIQKVDAPTAEISLSNLEKPKKSTAGKIFHYVKSNPGKVAMAVAMTMAGSNRRFDKNVDDMPADQQNNMAKALRSAIHLKDSKALKEMSFKFGITAGALTVGLAGLTLLTGVDLSVVIPLLATNFWEEIKDAPDNVEYLKNAGKAYFETVSKTLEDDEALTGSIMATKSSEAASLKVLQYKYITKEQMKILSSHESDINKTLVSIEKFDIEKASTFISSTSNAGEVIKMTSHLEDAIPAIASIFVTSVPRKTSLTERSRVLLNKFKEAHSKCLGKLNEIATTEKMAKTPLGHVIQKNLKYDKYNSSVTYVSTPDEPIQLCEVHRLVNVLISGKLLSHVNVYAYKYDSKLYLAMVINSDFIPKIFDVIAPKNVNSWLHSNLVI